MAAHTVTSSFLNTGLVILRNVSIYSWNRVSAILSINWMLVKLAFYKLVEYGLALIYAVCYDVFRPKVIWNVDTSLYPIIYTKKEMWHELIFTYWIIKLLSVVQNVLILLPMMYTIMFSRTITREHIKLSRQAWVWQENPMLYWIHMYIRIHFQISEYRTSAPHRHTLHTKWKILEYLQKIIH